MVNKSLYKLWFKKADEDYLFASAHLEDEDKFFAQICFHFHQAAEKYLKSYIVAKSLLFRKIHNLKELNKICKEKDGSFSEIEEACISLNQYYIDTRYPVYWPVSFTKKEAYQAKEKTGTIRNFIKSKLESLK